MHKPVVAVEHIKLFDERLVTRLYTHIKRPHRYFEALVLQQHEKFLKWNLIDRHAWNR
jgi:hypothetical protein